MERTVGYIWQFFLFHHIPVHRHICKRFSLYLAKQTDIYQFCAFAQTGRSSPCAVWSIYANVSIHIWQNSLTRISFVHRHRQVFFRIVLYGTLKVHKSIDTCSSCKREKLWSDCRNTQSDAAEASMQTGF